MARSGIMGIAVLMSASACGAHDETGDPGEERADVATIGASPREFTVGLGRATTAENVISQILKAGRSQVASACADNPDTFVRVFNPLAVDTYADFPCWALLSGSGATGEATAALRAEEQDGPIDEARQRWSPLGLGCGLFVLAAGTVASYALCPRARTPRNERNCNDWSYGGFSALSIMCAFM